MRTDPLRFISFYNSLRLTAKDTWPTRLDQTSDKSPDKILKIYLLKPYSAAPLFCIFD